MRTLLRTSLLAAPLLLGTRAKDDDDEDEDEPSASCKDTFADVNPSVPANLTSACAAGTYGDYYRKECTACPAGKTTEVWQVQAPGTLKCTVRRRPLLLLRRRRPLLLH